MSNGIFHKKKTNYVSRCSLIGSGLLILLTGIYVIHRVKSYNMADNISVLTVSDEELKDYMNHALPPQEYDTSEL